MRARLFALLSCLTFAASGLVAAATPAGAAAESIHFDGVTPSSPHVDDMLVVTATVSDATTPPATLSVVRTDRNGQQPPFSLTMTSNPGEFSGSDPLPAVWGRITYTVTDATGGAQTQGSVYAIRYTPTLTIRREHRVVSAGHLARVTAHLGQTSTNRTVAIYAQPYHRDRTQIRSGAVDATTGDLAASYTMSRRTRFIAKFGGDLKYRPASIYTVVRARAVVREHLRGGYATDGSYRLFHAAANPVLAVHLIPELDGVCLRFRAERHYNGAWHLVAVGCVRTDPDGRAIGVLTGDHHLNSPYRVRARYRGSFAVLAKSGAWQRLKFRP